MDTVVNVWFYYECPVGTVWHTHTARALHVKHNTGTEGNSYRLYVKHYKKTKLDMNGLFFKQLSTDKPYRSFYITINIVFIEVKLNSKCFV